MNNPLHDQDATSKWLQLNSLPSIQDFLVTDGIDNEFWMISKRGDNIEIFNYNINENTFTTYPHTISDQTATRITASFDKQNEILYIVTFRQIIIIDIKNSNCQQVDVNIPNEHCGSIIFDGQLHIVGDMVYLAGTATTHHILHKETNQMESMFIFPGNTIIHPHMTEFTRSASEKTINVIGQNVAYYYSKNDKVWRQLHAYLNIQYEYPFITTAYGDCTLFFKNNRIILVESHGDQIVEWVIKNICYYSNIRMPINPTHSILCKQSFTENNLLIFGYIKSSIKAKIIPMDIMDLLNKFYSSYDVHLFNDKNGSHYKISVDKILNNSQQYTGIIKSYDKTNKSGIIQIKGAINEFSGIRTRIPLIDEINDYMKPNKIQEPLVNAVKQMFQQFATNEDGTMCIDDMKRYILHCGAGENSATTQRVIGIFWCHEKSKNKLSLKGFLEFYAMAIIGRPHYVMDDLKQFGYKQMILFDANGECIDAIFGDYNYQLDDEESKLVDFDVYIDTDGIKHAINVTKMCAQL